MIPAKAGKRIHGTIMNRNLSFRIGLALTIASLVGAGCTTNYNQQVKTLNNRWQVGDTQGAAREAVAAASKQKSETGRDAVVWRLEEGAALRAASQYKESITAFETAEEGINVFEAKTKGKAALNETGAALSNPAILPYEGYAYDKVMLNTYKAADYLELGDFENARVEFNRAKERQDDALAINAARIEKAQDLAKTKKQNIDLEKIQNDTNFSGQWKTYYLDLDEMKFYAEYRNPFTEYLSGLFFMSQPTGGSDLQRARKSFELVLGMIGENKFIDEDMQMIDKAITGQQIPPTTYVIFETGLAPTRDQITIHLPLFLVTGKVQYVGLAFPRLKYHEGHVGALTVRTGDVNERTMMLSSMDRVIAQEFKNDMQRVIIRAVTSAAVKAGVSVGISEATKKEGIGGDIVKAIWDIYQIVQNQADMRTWNTLPKEIQFCHFPTPADRKIELGIGDSGPRTTLTLNDGVINLVWVRSVNQMSPLQISQCKLK
jgi:hypothetical protein